MDRRHLREGAPERAHGLGCGDCCGRRRQRWPARSSRHGHIGPSEAETFWTAFLRKLARCGLRGVKLVVSDAHEGIKATVAKVLNATWQRCRVHFMRNALAHAGNSGRRVVSAFIATAFAQDDAEAAKTQWRKVADQLRPKLPKLAGFLDEAETDVLAYMTFPPQHRTKLHSTNPIERLNGEIKRRSEVVGIFPNEDAIVRLIGAILLEQNDEWAVPRARYTTLETIAPLSDRSNRQPSGYRQLTSPALAGERGVPPPVTPCSGSTSCQADECLWAQVPSGQSRSRRAGTESCGRRSNARS